MKYLKFVLDVLWVSATIAAIFTGFFMLVYQFTGWLDANPQTKDIFGWSVLIGACLLAGTCVVLESRKSSKN